MASVSRFEIINPQEETDPAGKLFAHGRDLTLAISAREQDARRRAGRANHDPAFRPAVVGEGRHVFHELELQDVHKEIDRRVVLSHN